VTEGGERGAFDAYVEGWLAHEPEMRLARALVATTREPVFEALSVFDSLLLDAALDVRDTSVAAAKLAWWRAELVGSHDALRHPVSIRLATLGALEPGALLARVDAALALAEIESPPDPEALLAAFAAFARASEPTFGTAIQRALGAAILAMRLRRWPVFAREGRSRLPLATLAALGVTRAQAADDAVAGGRVLASLAGILAPMLEVSDAGLPVALRARLAAARGLVVAMLRSPARAVSGTARAAALPLLWNLWRAARSARMP